MHKKQVIVIGGGEIWDAHEEYMEYLRNYEYSSDKFAKAIGRRWKENLQEDLGDQYLVVRPEMPCKHNAKYAEWEIWFEKMIPYITDEAILIGHSLGANFVAKYFQENEISFKMGQIHLVAGCYGERGGFELSESLENVEKTGAAIYIYHSRDDFVVEFADAQKYKKALPHAELVEFENRGHFLQEHFSEIIENIEGSDKK